MALLALQLNSVHEFCACAPVRPQKSTRVCIGEEGGASYQQALDPEVAANRPSSTRYVYMRGPRRPVTDRRGTYLEWRQAISQTGTTGVEQTGQPVSARNPVPCLILGPRHAPVSGYSTKLCVRGVCRFSITIPQAFTDHLTASRGIVCAPHTHDLNDRRSAIHASSHRMIPY